MSIATIPKSPNKSDSNVHFNDTKKPGAVRDSNITAAKSVSDAIRTSLGPKGMDKMIVSSNGDVTITNDGATILNQMQLMHPVGRMLVSLSKAQDAEAGDGTTTVVVLAGCLLDAASRVLGKGIHPTVVSEAFAKAAKQARKILTDMSIPVELNDRNSLLQSASTALSSKIVSQCSALLANIAVDAVLKIIPSSEELGGEPNVDLKNIRILKKISGTIDDTELIDGMVMDMGTAGYGGPTRIEKAKIALIQFCISAPKTDMEHNVVISDYTQLDRALREERQYILNIIKEIRKTGCNVLLIQKSILRDAASELALHLLAKSKIMVIKDVEREDIEFTCKSLGCRPIASLDHFKPEAFGKAELVEQISSEAEGSKMVKFSGIQGVHKTVSIIIHGTNKLIVDEAERSLHDALCVIRCLVKERALIAGGGAPEIELALKLDEYALSDLHGAEQYCVRAYADSLEIVPYTLAENAGLNSIATLTELRKRHAQGARSTGISVRRAGVADMIEENVIQPLLVSTSAIVLATEAVRQILKIDDFVLAVRL